MRRLIASWLWRLAERLDCAMTPLGCCDRADCQDCEACR